MVYSTMARLARVVDPGYPYPVIQRGNRRQQTLKHAGREQKGKNKQVWCLLNFHS
ncbi:hypothetical protein ACFL4T_13955 [candidate division KSB1 bacterium]